jgi:hypothetical protein
MSIPTVKVVNLSVMLQCIGKCKNILKINIDYNFVTTAAATDIFV